MRLLSLSSFRIDCNTIVKLQRADLIAPAILGVLHFPQSAIEYGGIV